MVNGGVAGQGALQGQLGWWVSFSAVILAVQGLLRLVQICVGWCVLVLAAAASVGGVERGLHTCGRQ